MRKIVQIFILVALTTTIKAQETQKDIPFTKKHIKFKATLEAAIDSMIEGDILFNMELYKHALSTYSFPQQVNPNNSVLNFKIGICYLNGPHKDQARAYFEKSYNLEKKINEDIYYYLGRSFQFEGEWEKAKENYNKYHESRYAEEISEYIIQCDRAIELSKSPVNVNIVNVGPSVNTEYAEYSAIISADGSQIFFTSRRPSTTGGLTDFHEEWMEDIYKSDKIDGEWTESENVGFPVNSDGHDAMVSLSSDGQTLFIYRDENNNQGDIYICELEGDHWTTPIPLNNKINTKYHETSVSLAPDGKTLFFVSSIPGGFGEKDIYTAKLNQNGDWDSIQNIGSVINTARDEDAVFMHPDGKTLYFSSKGHNTIGGYDVFVSSLKNGQWLPPINIGIPINTADDDVFFVLEASGKNGYYTSGKIGGQGEKDIYLLEFEDVEEINIALLKGNILTEELVPIGATMLLIDDESGELVSTIQSNSATGEYLVTLENNKKYRIESSYEDYPDLKEFIDIPDVDGYQEIIKDFIFSYTKSEDIVSEEDTVTIENVITKPGYVYTLQYFATINLGKASKTKTYLESIGISDVYIQKVIFVDTDEINYRVRSGKYYSFEEAVADGQKLTVSILPDKGYWIDNVREEDYSVKKLEYDILN